MGSSKARVVNPVEAAVMLTVPLTTEAATSPEHDVRLVRDICGLERRWRHGWRIDELERAEAGNSRAVLNAERLIGGEVIERVIRRGYRVVERRQSRVCQFRGVGALVGEHDGAVLAGTENAWIVGIVDFRREPAAGEAALKIQCVVCPSARVVGKPASERVPDSMPLDGSGLPVEKSTVRLLLPEDGVPKLSETLLTWLAV